MDQNSLAIEGLETSYDIVVLGTNLAPSIVAAAAGFSKHTVLHLDANDFYGHLDDGTFSYDQAMAWASQLEKHQSSPESTGEYDDDDGVIQTKVHNTLESLRNETIDRGNIRIVRMNQEPALCAHLFSVGEKVQLPTKHVEEEVGDKTINFDEKQQEETEVNKEKEEGEIQEKQAEAEVKKEQEETEVKNSLSLDKIQAASRRFCIDVGSPMAIFANGTCVDLMVESGVGRYLEFLSMDSLNVFESKTASWRVPCSKRDIFSSKELSVMEKNKLMKLLRFVMDWGIVNISGNSDLSTQDDVELKAGRSLNRPQNKSVSSNVGVETSSIEYDLPFIEYLQSWKISKKLIDAIIYAIALLPDHSSHTTNTFDGLAATFRHLSALNHYGSTALLAPLYGGGEISQAFCRLCAVSRGTYLLRHRLHGLVVEKKSEGEEVVGICDDKGHLISTRRFVCSSDYLRRPLVWSEDRDLTESWTVRRVCILDGPIADGRSLTVIKPMTEGILNEAPIFVIQCDDSTESCPRGLGAYIVHLTTAAHVSMSSAAAAETLERAADALACSANANEVWHLCFGLPLEGSGGVDGSFVDKDQPALQGAISLERLPYSCDPHPLAAQAKNTFATLFIDKPYFEQSEEEREEAARARGEGDEEAFALDDALREDERQTAVREEKLRALIARVEKLETSDASANNRISKIEKAICNNSEIK